MGICQESSAGFLSKGGHPRRAVRPEEERRSPGTRSPFRSVPAELRAIDNNLNTANMDWEEFAGDDGVFRGFA